MLRLQTEAIVVIAVIVLFFFVGLVAVGYMMGACSHCWCCKTKGANHRDFDSLNELLFEVEEGETGILNLSDGSDNEDGGGETKREISFDAFFPDILKGTINNNEANDDAASRGLHEPLL